MTLYLERLGLLMLCALPVWVLLRRPWRRRPLWREAVMGCFVLFMAGLMVFTLEGDWASPAAMMQSARERIASMDRIWLKPFNTIPHLLSEGTADRILLNIVGNIVMFIPWGFCLPLLWRRFRSLPAIAGMCLGLTVFIECTQLFINRYVETDDVLLNFLGGMMGAGLWWLGHRLRAYRKKEKGSC